MPHEDEPNFIVGFHRTKDALGLYIIHTLMWAVTCTGVFKAELPRIGILRRLEIACDVEILRVRMTINRVQCPFDVDANFLPRRAGKIVAIEHGTLDLRQITEFQCECFIAPSATLTTNTMLKLTYWQVPMEGKHAP